MKQTLPRRVSKLGWEVLTPNPGRSTNESDAATNCTSSAHLLRLLLLLYYSATGIVLLSF